MLCVVIGNRIENDSSTIVRTGQSFNFQSSEIHFLKTVAHMHFVSNKDGFCKRFGAYTYEDWS